MVIIAGCSSGSPFPLLASWAGTRNLHHFAHRLICWPLPTLWPCILSSGSVCLSVSPDGSIKHSQNPVIRQDIVLDDPFKHYAPGDSVKGTVQLQVAKAVRVTHLVVRLHGFVKVVNRSKLPGEAIPYDEHLLNSSTGRRGGEYYGNGFARLFGDEQVLCGDGKLSGPYAFEFELLLPRKGVPTSIDFENGTIKYILTSTLTKPTTISPTLIKECKLKIKENIDIASVPQPPPQFISVNSSKKSRRPDLHLKRKLSTTPAGDEGATTGLEDTRRRSLPSLSSNIEAPGSPVPSDICSVASANSSNTSSTCTGTATSIPGEARTALTGTPALTASEKTITAQTQVLQGGFLPGDTIPVRISIDHRNPVKNMQGVIITVYRFARIDTHPPIPLGPSNGNQEGKPEDLYPKSLTGLSGLSLSSKGCSRTFRQEVAQTITPLIVDKHGLTAVIKTSVQIPDHIFPSINGVPGSMISFRYFVEVVIDLKRKVTQDRILDRFNMVDGPQHGYGDAKVNMVDGKDGVTFSTTPGFNFLITDQVKRQKFVIYTNTEIVVGTRDSARLKGKQKANGTNVSPDERSTIRDSAPTNDIDPTLDGQSRAPPYQDSEEYNGAALQTRERLKSGWRDQSSVQVPISPPQAAEEPLSEKARIRRAEETLLPSAPPESDQSPTNSGQAPLAHFPYNEEDLAPAHTLHTAAPAYEGPSDRTQELAQRDEPESGLAPVSTLMEHANDGRETAPFPIEGNAETTDMSGGTMDPVPHITPSAPIFPESSANNPVVVDSSGLPLHVMDGDPSFTYETSIHSTGPDTQEAQHQRLPKLARSPDDADDSQDTQTSTAPAVAGASAANPSELNTSNPDRTNDETNNDGLPAYQR